PGGLVAIRNLHLLHVYFGQAQIGRLFRLLVLALGLHEIREIHRAVLAAHHVGLQSGELERLDGDLAGKQRHHAHRDLGRIERQEQLVAAWLADRSLAQRDAGDGKQLYLRHAVDFERAVPFLHGTFQAPLDELPVHDRDRRTQRHGGKRDESRDAEQHDLDCFHGVTLSLLAMPNGTWPVATCWLADATWPR